MVSCVLLKQLFGFILLLLHVAMILVSENFVESLYLCEFKNAILVQISCREDVCNVLKLLFLQLIGCVDHKLCEVIELHRLCIGVQVQELILQGLSDSYLLPSYLLQSLITPIKSLTILRQ